MENKPLNKDQNAQKFEEVVRVLLKTPPKPKKDNDKKVTAPQDRPEKKS